jgi:RNA recognition motif-containing protein
MLGELPSLSQQEGNNVRIYIGNISREVTDDDLREAFAAFGQVESATVLKDKFTGESRGFGFVEMLSGSEAKAAINGMNGKDLKGRTLNVNEARPREDNRGGGGGGGGFGGGGFGGGGGGFGGGGRSSGPRRPSGGGKQRY